MDHEARFAEIGSVLKQLALAQCGRRMGPLAMRMRAAPPA